MSPANRRAANPASPDPQEAMTEPEALAPPAGGAGGDSAPPEGSGQPDAEGRATAQPPRRSGALHPERVWPD